MISDELTHFNNRGEAHMVDVGGKPHTKRMAIASGKITVNETAYNKILAGDSKKGDVLGIARIAAIQGAKQTSSLIPLCHPIALTKVNVDFSLNNIERSITICVQTENTGQTGVEMEALTAASVGLLTIYDMLKAVDRCMVLSQICLQHKEGGQSGLWQRQS
ncbi:cyclic pyranopterin monophosphate synthase MoaC [Snodgrassella alvi]|uniref:cyclic pyranopterin monophosphate synthase MoaC n=1 Tax=Snodgrassella alvi TaxID=1196083 RepID=UPI000C1E1183|nr:cyclic pyranopterin monophosphate synthase MoaC [Snodgrassella alvi]PIT42016.1 molybdenum cofactor biosynthesis protein C [Snodgrassella alvi]